MILSYSYYEARYQERLHSKTKRTELNKYLRNDKKIGKYWKFNIHHSNLITLRWILQYIFFFNGKKSNAQVPGQRIVIEKIQLLFRPCEDFSLAEPNKTNKKTLSNVHAQHFI